ncbi:unnamed protein product, partial [Callosobruchus maculatus]
MKCFKAKIHLPYTDNRLCVFFYLRTRKNIPATIRTVFIHNTY